MRKLIVTAIIIFIANFSFSQVKNLPESSTFFDFLREYNAQKDTTMPADKQIERLTRIWTTRLVFLSAKLQVKNLGTVTK
jgi:hypothetical protein